MPKLLTGIASPVDIPDIINFWNSSKQASLSSQASGSVLEDYISSNPFMCLVAEQDQRIIATVVYGIKSYRGFIHHIAVDPEYLNSGIVRKLTNQAFAALAQRSCSRCHIFVHDMASNPVTQEVVEEVKWAQAAGSQIFTHDLEFPLADSGLLTD